jgi:hypothetical protein
LLTEVASILVQLDEMTKRSRQNAGRQSRRRRGGGSSYRCRNACGIDLADLALRHVQIKNRPKAAQCGHPVFEPSVLRVSGGATIQTMWVASIRSFLDQYAQEIVSVAAAGRLSNYLCAIGETERLGW